jgi:hypothetical protein
VVHYFGQMPVDLALSTNTPTATIELRQAQALGEGHHLAAFLLVRSGAFAAAMPFVFARDELVAFANALDVLMATRSGEAPLHGWENEDIIRFATGHDGQLRISGRLHEAPAVQQLTFSFAAEWVGLESFVADLRQLRVGTAK